MLLCNPCKIKQFSISSAIQIKKQREAAKREQQAVPAEYASFRQFSIQSSEVGQSRQLDSVTSFDAQTQQLQPSFVTSSINRVTQNV